MSQFADVTRFCAIEGRLCEKHIPYQGTDTFFFAYPSGDYWQDFSEKLVDELMEQGVLGQRWEDTIGNDVLFSKVCEGIYGHDYLLAEVTEPNANVLLEIGYALAVGRLPILLNDRNRKAWDRELLTTLESCFYETRLDILAHILTRLTDRGNLPEHPNRRLPMLEKMGIFDREEEPGTICHLKPKLPRDWISAVEKKLKESSFRITGTDPSDSSYDEFFPQARAIQSASLIVASLLGTDIEAYPEHNANVALLIGFAIGLGKEMLVLQQEPKASILDLGTVSHLFTTETQASGIASTWLQNQTRLALEQRAESRQRATARRRMDLIRDLYMGHPDALQDSRLLDYFVETPEYLDAIAPSGRRMIFIGRRGSGKSANFQAIREALRDRHTTIPVEIAPDDYELERISQFLETHYPNTNPKLLYRNTWNFILITEIVKALAEKTDRLYSSPDDLDRNTLYQYYESHKPALQLDFGSRLTAALTREFEASSTGSRGPTNEDTEKALMELRDYRIAPRLRELARREGIFFYIVADDLDKQWRPSTQQSIEILLGLMDEAVQLQRYFEDQLKVVMFLREDIFDVLAQADEDLPKRSFWRMEWTVPNLKHLVAARLAIGADIEDEDDETIWSAVFPDTIQGLKSSEYILSRTLARPRDVLGFCQAAIDQAQLNGHPSVSAQDILDGEIRFANSFGKSLAAEFRGLYPNLEEVLFEFAEVPTVMQWTEFEEYANEAIEKQQSVLTEWVGKKGLSPISVADTLFQIGVIGLAPSTSDTAHFRNGRSFAETWRVTSPAPSVQVHPAFYTYLDVSEAKVRRPRTRRRTRTTDQRQLSFGQLA